MAEIADQDLTTLQAAYRLMQGLWDHPEHGATVKRAAKQINPNLRIPEIDVAEPLLKPLREQLTAAEEGRTALQARLDKLEQDRTDDKELDKLQKSLDAAKTRYRLTDEGMAEVRKVMAERNNADPMAAAAFVASEIEPPKPVSGSNFSPSDANIFGVAGGADDDSTKRLHTDPVKWLDREVPNILREFEDAA